MVTRDYPPEIGGVAIHASNLVAHLRGLGLKVDVFRGGSDSRTAALAVSRGFAGDYDVLHVQSLPYGALTTFHPLVVTIHSPVLEEAKYYTGTSKTKAPVAILFEKAALRKADAAIAVSQVTFGQLLKDYGASRPKLKLIPNGVDCERFSPRLKSWGRETRILMCSRLEPRKNIGEALVSFAMLKNGEFRVDIIGEGPERAELQKRAAATGKPIFFRGVAAQTELEECFSKAEIFVSTSWSEGFGLSLLQAMASGCAVVASNIPSHRELINHGREGLLYSSQPQLAESIAKLMRDKPLAKKLGENAREKARAYSWENVAKATAEVYRELVR